MTERVACGHVGLGACVECWLSTQRAEIAASYERAELKETAKVLVEERARLTKDNARLRNALRTLYDETAEYIRLNHLGDVHHNRSMQWAREALGDKT